MPSTGTSDQFTVPLTIPVVAHTTATRAAKGSTVSSILGTRCRVDAADDPWRLHCAAHELGHMLVWQANGFDITGITVTGHGSDVEGATLLTQESKSLHTPDRCRLYLVGLLAGREADIRWAKHVGRPFRERHSGHDLRAFRDIHRHEWVCGIPAGELRAQAGIAVAGLWGQILMMAPILARKGSV